MIKDMYNVQCPMYNTIYPVQEGKFTARVIRRELAMITKLMTPENFKGVKNDDGTAFNISTARDWFEVGGESEDWSEYKTVFRTISSLATVKSSTSTAPHTAVASTTPANKERC